MRAGLLGQIATPAAGNRIVPGVEWIGDNGVYGGTYPGDDVYLAWLAARVEHRDRCRFVVAPDVVADWDATLARSLPMLPRLGAAGWPAAIVLQDGATEATVPWDQIAAVFVGGSTLWKLGPEARALVAAAKRRGVWVHMGRVNSCSRLRYADWIGCDSADGTYLAFGPHANLPKLLSWLTPALPLEVPGVDA